MRLEANSSFEVEAAHSAADDWPSHAKPALFIMSTFSPPYYEWSVTCNDVWNDEMLCAEQLPATWGY